jgi:Fungal N-terminal domain of STAND proteins
MTDPLSVTAAAVSLAQIAITLGLELFGFISKLKGASTELRRLNRELEDLTNTITQIRNLSQTYRESDILSSKGDVFNIIESGLKSFVEDATRLKNIVEEPSRQYDTMVSRFGKRVKLVLNERQILKILQRLVSYKTTLHLALSIISG